MGCFLHNIIYNCLATISCRLAEIFDFRVTKSKLPNFPSFLYPHQTYSVLKLSTQNLQYLGCHSITDSKDMRHICENHFKKASCFYPGMNVSTLSKVLLYKFFSIENLFMELEYHERLSVSFILFTSSILKFPG